MTAITGKYDILVVGSGHAAVEAALAGARLGHSVAIVTLNPENVAGMPCNPAVGGPGKAQIVSEIDALGGEMALATDHATIELRVLNASKGPAVQSLRAQVDKKAYAAHMKRALGDAGVTLLGGMVVDIPVSSGAVRGVVLGNGDYIAASRVILCTGVYLESRIIIGDVVKESGPLGEPAAKGLSDALRRLGIALGRFKTGTSPRIAADSVRWEELKKESGAPYPLAFSFLSKPRVYNNDVCYSTYTNERTHEIIRANLHRSPLFDGTIRGTGPRYCPSIEDKVYRFPERERHQIFLEMEARDSDEVYILGLSTSLPVDVQVEVVRSLPGLKEARIVKPGYAIEYDRILSHQIKPSLEVVGIEGLYSAGQINGTSGYEEAAAQGLMAGINAALSLEGKPPVILERSQAYIGVLIDDLVSNVIDEPYRMLTSRCEYRLMLRQQNADQRLTPLGREIGLVSDARWRVFEEKRAKLEKGRELLGKKTGGVEVRERLKAPDTRLEDFLGEIPELALLPEDVRAEIEIEAKYSGFIERQEREAKRLQRYAGKRIPPGFDPSEVPGLSREARDKLRRYAPATIGRALEVGVSPQDALILLAYMKNRGSGGAQGDE